MKLGTLINGLSLSILLFGSFIAFGAHAKEVRINFGLSLAPYVIAKESKGIEIDIIRAALQKAGHELIAVYTPLARIPLHIKQNFVDGATPLTKQFSPDYYYSNSHVTYQNVALSMAADNISLQKIEDLKPYSLMAFQNATLYLGDNFRSMAKQNKYYMESHDQTKQINYFYSKRVQLIVIDENIFRYYRTKGKPGLDINAKITWHHLFPPNHYVVAFKDKALRDQFNNGLETIKNSGEHQQIIDNYVNQ